MSPFNAFQFIQGLETLPLRMRAHCATRRRSPTTSPAHPEVTRVIHPALQTGEARAPRRHVSEGRLRRPGRLRAGGRHARPGARFIDALKLFYHVANIGDARSLAIHPATHHALAALGRGAARDRRDAAAMCGCRSASSTSTTSSPTWSAASPPDGSPRRRA